LTVLLLAGCAVHPVPLTESEDEQRAHADFSQLFASQEQLPGTLTLSEAIARAVKYNMDYRQRLMEQAVALGQTQLATYDLLPKLTLSAGYNYRNNDSFGFGFNENGQISSNPTASQERIHDTAGIDFAWNVLDFGLSYVRAKQLADQALIADEQRRKVLQNLIQDVRQAWWRAQFAQQLLPEIEAQLADIQTYAARAQLIEQRRLLPPLQIVAYRRSLLDLEQQLSARHQDLSQAQIEFASLLNLAPGTKFKLAEVHDDDMATPDLTADSDALEMLALENRPELKQEQYKGRLTDREWQKQVLSLLPNFGLDVSRSYDSNKFLINNQWTTAGYNFSFGLLKLFSLPAAKQANEAQKATDDARRLAVAAGVVGQTRMAAVRYQLLIEEYGVWDSASRDDARIVNYLSSSRESGLETELELIRAKGRALISKSQRDLVYSNVQGAIGRLYNSVGLDALPRTVESQDTKALAAVLKGRIDQWEQTNFTEKPSLELAPITFSKIELPADGLEPFESAMNRVLRLSKINVIADRNTDYKLSASLKFEPPQSGGQIAILNLQVTDKTGAVVASGEQKSMLVSPVGREQWDAFGESAAYKIVQPLLKVLRRTPDSRAISGTLGSERQRYG
jgi:outer membrane protein TolC